MGSTWKDTTRIGSGTAGAIHTRRMHPARYDPVRMKPSRMRVDYLLPIFTDAIGNDDAEHMRQTLFAPENLS